MKKSEFNKLIILADEKLRAANLIHNNNISKKYDGKTAALSVSVAMSDILPTLSIYYQEFEENGACRRKVLNVVATMINRPGTTTSFQNAETLVRFAVSCNANDLQYIKRQVIDCAIALKHVVRTYNLV